MHRYNTKQYNDLMSSTHWMLEREMNLCPTKQRHRLFVTPVWVRGDALVIPVVFMVDFIDAETEDDRVRATIFEDVDAVSRRMRMDRMTFGSFGPVVGNLWPGYDSTLQNRVSSRHLTQPSIRQNNLRSD